MQVTKQSKVLSDQPPKLVLAFTCKDAMECYKPIPTFNISIGDKTKLQVIGSGNVKLTIMVDEKLVKCTIENFKHVAPLGYN